MKKIFRKTLAVLMYLFYLCAALSIPVGFVYLFFSDNPKIKPAIVAIIAAVTIVFFFVEDVRVSGGLKKHFKQFIS